MSTQSSNPDNEQKGEKMVGRNISIELSLWERAKAKAGPTRSLSAIIRELIKKWLAGEIRIDNE